MSCTSSSTNQQAFRIRGGLAKFSICSRSEEAATKWGVTKWGLSDSARQQVLIFSAVLQAEPHTLTDTQCHAHTHTHNTHTHNNSTLQRKVVFCLMLGQGCPRALFGKQFPPPLKWVKNGFLSMSQKKAKVGKKVGFDPFSPSCAPKNPHFTHFEPISGDWQKPI